MAATPLGDPAESGSTAPVLVPEELDVLPPGQILAEVLDEVPVEQVCGFDAVRLLEAAYRQLCHDRALFLSILRETGLRRPGSVTSVERTTAPTEFSCEEARAALVWSRIRAATTYALAMDVFDRLPMLGEAMLRGELDEPRARAFVEWTQGLTVAQAAEVCDKLLPEAPRLMVGELIDRIKRACLAIDPGLAEKKYRMAVRTRRVVGSRNPDGTANLGGYQQPLDRVAAAAERINTLARACKRAGDGRPIDHTRSDLFLGMTDGTFEGMTDAEIINYVLANPYVDPGDQPDGGDGRDDGDGGGGRGGGSGDGQTGGAPPTPDGKAPTGKNPGDDQPARRLGAGGRSWTVPEPRVELSTILGRFDHVVLHLTLGAFDDLRVAGSGLDECAAAAGVWGPLP